MSFLRKNRAVAALLAISALVAMLSFGTYAVFTDSEANPGNDVSVGELTAPSLAQPTASGGSVPLGWSAATLPGNASLETDITYTIERKLGAGSFGAAGGTCTGSLTTTSCTDSVGASGSYTYRVVAHFRTWTATSNERTVAVTVGTAAPAAPSTVALANGAGAGNAYINGANRANLSVQVGLPASSSSGDTVRVTMTDGANTTAERTAAATNGAGSVTVTGIDATSLSDGSVTIRATSSNGSGSSAATTASVEKDTGAPASAATAPQYANSAPITVSYTASDPGSGVDEVELWAKKSTDASYVLVTTDSDPTTPSFAYTPASGAGTYQFYTRARDDAANHEAAPLTPPDASTIYDLTNPASSAGSIASSVSSASTLTVPYTASDTGGSGLNEVELWVKQPGDADYSLFETRVSSSSSGNFSYPIAAGDDGTHSFYTRARDNAGNYEAAPANPDRTTSVSIRPTAVGIQAINGGATAGKLENGDQVIVSFSEAVAPASIRPGWSDASVPRTGQTISFLNNSATDELKQESNPHIGLVKTMGDYLSGNVNFTSSTLTLSTDGKTLTITLGGLNTPANVRATAVSAKTMEYTPDADLDDLAGNSIDTATAIESGAVDVDF